MQDSKQIEFIAERVVSEVLSRHLPEIRQEMVRRVMAELPDKTSSDSGTASAVLEAAMAALQGVSSQADILNVLLDFAARFSGRVGLFVVRSDFATVWQARGFPDDNGLRNFSLSLTGAAVSRVLQERVAVAGFDFDSAFLARVGHAAGGNAILLPLVLREKVSALVYADCGLEGGKLDVAALKLLIRCAGIWLELLALRRAVSGTPDAEPAPARAEQATPAERSYATAAASGVAAAEASTVGGATGVAAPQSQWTAEDRDLHLRAQRYARLLVDEIKLYNQSKVAEGRVCKDLYDRLKEDIDKSRASYDRRYGGYPAGFAEYFTKELVHILADDDPSLLGANFPG